MEEAVAPKPTFEEFEKPRVKRRKLLPWWIKVFCWIFMLFGVMAVISLILGFTEIKPALALYGFETNEPFSLIGLLVIALGIFKGMTAFALWFEHDLGITFGRIDAIIGIVICTASMFIIPFIGEGVNVTIRLELVLLIPFLMKLNKIRPEWESAEQL
ncbi:MAG: hypothetical protein HRU26_07215 [Psychroserpens sp.]|nr:hypothetical protein [Psychroserpens sp.]